MGDRSALRTALACALLLAACTPTGEPPRATPRLMNDWYTLTAVIGYN